MGDERAGDGILVVIAENKVDARGRWLAAVLAFGVAGLAGGTIAAQTCESRSCGEFERPFFPLLDRFKNSPWGVRYSTWAIVEDLAFWIGVALVVCGWVLHPAVVRK